MDSEKGTGRLQSDNRQAFKEWTEKRLQAIGVFGYQNGISQTEFAPFLSAVFDTFYARLPKAGICDAEVRLFQIASEAIPGYNGGNDGTLLKFQEDIEVHNRIQELAMEQRIPFVLHFLHGKDLEQTARIADRPATAVGFQLKDSLAFVAEGLGEDEQGIVKRIELATKSYSRIPFEMNEEKQVVEEEGPSSSALVKPVKPQAVDKKNKVLLIGASVFLAGVIGASFFLDDPNANVGQPQAEAEEGETVTAEMIEAWKEEYQEAKASSPEKLGMAQDVFENLRYVQEADQQLKWTFSKNNIEKLKDDPKEMEHQVNLLLLKIETPQTMLAMLPEMYLLHEEFVPMMEAYSLKTKELMYEGNQVLRQHEEELAGMTVNGELSPEKLMAQREGIPAEVKKLAGSIRERGLIIAKHPAKERFILRHNMESLYSNELMNTMMYDFNHLRYEPYFDEEGLLVPVMEMPYALSMLEQYVVHDDVSSEKFQEYAYMFQHSFWLLMKGDDNQQVFDENGKVKEAYQLAWKELGQQTLNPLIFVMLPIIEEMEESGWTESESYELLEYESIMEAVELEKEGELAAKLPNGDVKVEKQQVQAEEFFAQPIENLYAAFSAGYDEKLLKGASPLDVFRVFQFANQKKDIETMWHLMDDRKMPLEEYKLSWRQQPSFAEDIRWMEVAEENVNRIGKLLFVYPHISYIDEESIVSYHPELVMGEKGIWKVKSHLFERYEEAGALEAFKAKVERLYTAYSAGLDDGVIAAASPGEVGGLYLLAAEKKNFEMLKALSLGGQEQSPEIIEAQLKARGIAGLSAVGTLHFFNDPSYMMEQEMSTGSLWFSNTSDEGAGTYGSQLGMSKTPGGWRLEDLSMY